MRSNYFGGTLSETEARRLAHNVVLSHLTRLKNVYADEITVSVVKNVARVDTTVSSEDLLDDMANVAADVDEIVDLLRRYLADLRKDDGLTDAR